MVRHVRGTLRGLLAVLLVVCDRSIFLSIVDVLMIPNGRTERTGRVLWGASRDWCGHLKVVFGAVRRIMGACTGHMAIQALCIFAKQQAKEIKSLDI